MIRLVVACCLRRRWRTVLVLTSMLATLAVPFRLIPSVVLLPRDMQDTLENRDRFVGRRPDHEKRLVPTLTITGERLAFDYSSCYKVPNKAPTAVKKRPNCPSLFIIGTRKGGTTSLIQYLSKHPSFKGPLLDKGPFSGETNYFHRDFKRKSWQEYLSHFPTDSISKNRSIGESSVIYSSYCKAAENIRKSCGTEAKIVYLLRNPYRRFESNYLFRVREGFEKTANFSTCFSRDWIQLMNICKDLNTILDFDLPMNAFSRLACASTGVTPNMLYEGLYLVHLSHWLCNWPAKNIMIVNSEEFFTSPGKIVNQVFDFIGIDKMDPGTLKSISSSVYNKGVGNVSYSSEHREMIQKLYEPFNKKLLELLKWTSLDWSI